MLELIDIIFGLYEEDYEFWSNFSIGEVIDIIEFITTDEQ